MWMSVLELDFRLEPPKPTLHQGHQGAFSNQPPRPSTHLLCRLLGEESVAVILNLRPSQVCQGWWCQRGRSVPSLLTIDEEWSGDRRKMEYWMVVFRCEAEVRRKWSLTWKLDRLKSVLTWKLVKVKDFNGLYPPYKFSLGGIEERRSETETIECYQTQK